MFLKHEYKRGAFNVDRSEDFNVLKENGLYDIFIEEYLSKDFIWMWQTQPNIVLQTSILLAGIIGKEW